MTGIWDEGKDGWMDEGRNRGWYSSKPFLLNKIPPPPTGGLNTKHKGATAFRKGWGCMNT